ncbi:MAG: ATP-dependent helicase HrpB [Candidatus Sericytochromatia bacterium]|nr:ATP-dependent helicase HrpB [Candidatus Sericytochromatia bacterium]
MFFSYPTLFPRAVVYHGEVSDPACYPIDAHLPAIRAALQAHGRLVLQAPPGTGKSTRVPWALTGEAGEVVVLQPRRVAARALAQRVAQLLGEPLGQRIGYRVRFDRAGGPQTRLWFQTYGVFWQRVRERPDLAGVACVVLDEFHERSLEADAVLAWLTRLRESKRPDLQLVVMSATLDGESWQGAWAQAPCLSVASEAHPVALEYLPPRAGEALPAHVLRALRHLDATAQQGSVLVFLPGVAEIQRTADLLQREWPEREVLALHGAQSPEAQQRALSRPAERDCVVLATNVAETSLTIAGVTAVIDSGQARIADYDPESEFDRLRLGWVARANMIQRMGRAGRTGPGRCLRLWASSLESSLPEALPPELARRDLARLALEVASLPAAPLWLLAPPEGPWLRAHERLRQLGALDSGGALTPLGEQLLRYPVAPAHARVLVAAALAGCFELAAAMVAILEVADRRRIADEPDLLWLAVDMLQASGPRRAGHAWERDVLETWRQLCRAAQPPLPAPSAPRVWDGETLAAQREAITRCWLLALPERVAARGEKAYVLRDGRRGLVPQGDPPELILVLQLHAVEAASGRHATIPLYLPLEAAWLEAAETSRCVVSWDAARARVVQERHWVSAGVVTRRETLPPEEWDWRAAESLMVEKWLAGDLSLPAWDEEVASWVARVRKAAEVWPEMGIPRLERDDWEVLYHEVVQGKTGLGGITPRELIAALHDYVGWEAIARIERAAPLSWKLPSGRSARIRYPEEGPPELSARLGDMIGLGGTLSLFEGRVPVLFDILAPNYRTVQKTFDMDGFWARTYPEVKKELRRRYPKHPWP